MPIYKSIEVSYFDLKHFLEGYNDYYNWLINEPHCPKCDWGVIVCEYSDFLYGMNFECTTCNKYTGFCPIPVQEKCLIINEHRITVIE